MRFLFLADIDIPFDKVWHCGGTFDKVFPRKSPWPPSLGLCVTYSSELSGIWNPENNVWWLDVSLLCWASPWWRIWRCWCSHWRPASGGWTYWGVPPTPASTSACPGTGLATPRTCWSSSWWSGRARRRGRCWWARWPWCCPSCAGWRWCCAVLCV